jgi:DNA-binding NtrC family response regulator
MNAAKAQLEVPSTPAEQKRAVLIIDNEPLIQRLLTRVLHSEFSVTVAESVEDALEALESQAFFAIVADFELGHPQLNGEWVLGEARRIAPDTRRLLMSGHPMSLRAAKKRGDVHRVLQKPFARAALLKALDPG